MSLPSIEDRYLHTLKELCPRDVTVKLHKPQGTVLYSVVNPPSGTSNVVFRMADNDGRACLVLSPIVQIPHKIAHLMHRDTKLHHTDRHGLQEIMMSNLPPSFEKRITLPGNRKLSFLGLDCLNDAYASRLAELDAVAFIDEQSHRLGILRVEGQEVAEYPFNPTFDPAKSPKVIIPLPAETAMTGIVSYAISRNLSLSVRGTQFAKAREQI
jgi:hypothetical protein